ncbi:MAG TPA: hypothetical protein VIH71_02600 [Solirubrobacteraceae bacterium]
MTRHVLIREGNKPGSIVAEAELPTEAELHDALTRYPELIPLSDIGMGTGVVIGRESSLAAGYADLVLVDDGGQLCIVEVKNAGNPDTRRVVAQLLDYAASLWGATVDELTSRILHPYLEHAGSSEPPSDIGEFVARAAAGDDATPEQASAISGGLANNLATGDFALVVAAPQIPSGVQRVIEYLNARGQRLYGLEVSYFKDQVECFVPRLVVRPLVSDPAGAGSRTAGIDRETFLASVADAHEATVSELLNECDAAGADLSWNKSGPSIFVTRGQRRQVGYIETTRLGIVLATPSGFPAAPFDDARRELSEAGLGTETSSGWYRSISLNDPRLEEATRTLLDLISALVPAVSWIDLAEPVEHSFTRNDFNVWEAHIPGLTDFHGKTLRAILRHEPSGASATANLAPLAGGQPGWRPVFLPASGREAVWTGATLGDPFTVEVSASD